MPSLHVRPRSTFSTRVFKSPRSCSLAPQSDRTGHVAVGRQRQWLLPDASHPRDFRLCKSCLLAASMSTSVTVQPSLVTAHSAGPIFAIAPIVLRKVRDQHNRYSSSVLDPLPDRIEICSGVRRISLATKRATSAFFAGRLRRFITCNVGHASLTCDGSVGTPRSFTMRPSLSYWFGASSIRSWTWMFFPDVGYAATSAKQRAGSRGCQPNCHRRFQPAIAVGIGYA